MTREQFDNAINEAVLALDDAADVWRAKGFSEQVINQAVNYSEAQIQQNYCRYLKEESDMRINEAVLVLDDAEDGLRNAGYDEATIQAIYEPIYSQIQENAARAEIRFAPIREAFSDSVFAGTSSAGIPDVSAAPMGFPHLGNSDSLTYGPDSYTQSVGNGSIMGESGLPSIINKEALARMAYNEIAGYNAPEPKPSPEAEMDQFMSQLF